MIISQHHQFNDGENNSYKDLWQNLEFCKTNGKGIEIKTFDEDEFGNRTDLSVYLEFEEMEKLIEIYRE